MTRLSLTEAWYLISGVEIKTCGPVDSSYVACVTSCLYFSLPACLNKKQKGTITLVSYANSSLPCSTPLHHQKTESFLRNLLVESCFCSPTPPRAPGICYLEQSANSLYTASFKLCKFTWNFLTCHFLPGEEARRPSVLWSTTYRRAGTDT